MTIPRGDNEIVGKDSSLQSAGADNSRRAKLHFRWISSYLAVRFSLPWP